MYTIVPTETVSQPELSGGPQLQQSGIHASLGNSNAMSRSFIILVLKDGRSHRALES